MPEPELDVDISSDENVNVYTTDQHLEKYATNYSTLNRCQLEICEDVIMSIEEPDKYHDRLFFVDGPGGTGKTFLLEVINCELIFF